MSGCVPFVALQDVYVFCILMPSVSRQYIHRLNIVQETAQIAFHCRTDVGTSVGPTLGQQLFDRRANVGENYILCIASANQMMFIDNFRSVNF